MKARILLVLGLAAMIFHPAPVFPMEGRLMLSKEQLFDSGVITSYSIHYTKLYDVIGVADVGFVDGVAIELEHVVNACRPCGRGHQRNNFV